MALLDFLFGKGSAKHAKAINKAMKAIGGNPKKPALKREKPAHTKVTWTKSDKGNDTAEIDGWRITIFPQDGIWNYCASEILDEEDIAEGVEDVPCFGDLYPTKAEAKREAIAFVK